MRDWLTFEGRIEPQTRGDRTRTIRCLPAVVEAALIAVGAGRVEGEINGQPVSDAIARAPVVEGAFLWTGQSLLDRIDPPPGERLEARLRSAPDTLAETSVAAAAPPDRSGALPAWEAASPGGRRGLIHQIGAAETRGTRIAALIRELAGTA